MKFNLLAVFFIFFTYQTEVFAEMERCEASDTSKWTNCFGPAIFDGDTYVGSFKNGVPHGKGTYTYSDGATYVGGFLNGKESGEGIFNCWVHGATYVGSFKNSKKHGFGVYNYPNGDLYEGYWRDGKKNGEGTYTYKDGKINLGVFKDDKFVKESE